MRHVLIGLLLLAAMLVTALPAHAVPSCIGAGNVALLTEGCNVGGLHFDDFLVTVIGPPGVTATVFLTDVVDSTLGFDVFTQPTTVLGTVAVTLGYSVSEGELGAVPEPATLVLVGSTLVGVGLVARKYQPRRRRAAQEPVGRT